MSVLKRKDRPSLYLQARTRTGWKQISTGTKDRRLAKEIDRMWDILASGREWDLLEQVENHTLVIGKLFDAWRDARGNTATLRQKLNDADIAALLPEYLDCYAGSGVSPDTVAHARTALLWLFPEGVAIPASQLDAAWLSQRLTTYPASASTRRKIHSLWSGFFNYRPVRSVFLHDPMGEVERPKQRKLPPRFYDWPYVEQILRAQPTPERAGYFALLYGTGLDVSDGLQVRRSDIDERNRQIRAPGTKAHTRDRIVTVDDRVWDLFWAIARRAIGMAHVFPQWNRHTVSHWHGATVKALGFEVRYPLKNARHHWAATHLRAGVSIYVVQRQLGHSTPMLTLNTYGQFIPSAADLRADAKKFADYEFRRFSANGGAR
ncbi:MAG: tyrosine-type recombinase/integrase [Gemmatimonadetes bacterium]|nr:tyrosine-type recombinase/integrase [Gemmatimonadota bacterium]